MAYDFATILSVIAIAVSLITSAAGIYLQFFHYRGPNIILLNDQEEQKAVPVPYESLPMKEKELLPFYPEEEPGYAVLDLAFANSGDRIAYVHLKEVQAATVEGAKLPAAFYNYSILQPNSVLIHRIMVRNIPLNGTRTETPITIIADWGGVRRRRKVVEKENATYHIKFVTGPRS